MENKGAENQHNNEQNLTFTNVAIRLLFVAMLHVANQQL